MIDLEIIIIIIKLYLYSTFHRTHAARSAVQNDTSQVKNKQQEIPLRLFVKNFTGTCSEIQLFIRLIDTRRSKL